MKSAYFAAVMLWTDQCLGGVTALSTYGEGADGVFSVSSTSAHPAAVRFTTGSAPASLAGAAILAGVGFTPESRLYSNGAGNVPGAFIGFLGSNPILAVGDEHYFEATGVGGYSLLSDTSYWIAFVPTSTEGDIEWYAHDEPVAPVGLPGWTTDGMAYRAIDGATWSPDGGGNQVAFRLVVVPEPAALGAIALGALFFGTRRRGR